MRFGNFPADQRSAKASTETDDHLPLPRSRPSGCSVGRSVRLRITVGRVRPVS